MPITTVETVDIKYSGVTVDTYGLSDTLDNYTIDDIKNYLYCSCTNRTIRGFQEFVNNGDITLFNGIFPFHTTKLATGGRFLFDVNDGSVLPIPDGAYVFTVWLQCSNTLELTSSNISNAKMVTAMNAPRMKYTLPNPKGTKDNITTWSGGDGSQCYQTGSDKGSLAYVHNIDAHNTVDIGISDVHPYMIIVLENVVFFWRFRMDQMKFLSRPQNHGTYGSNFVGGRCVTAFDESTYSVLGTKIRTLDVSGGLPYDWGTGTGSSTSGNPNAYGTADDDRIIYAEGGGNNNQTQFGCIRFYWYPNTRHEALLLWAGIGVKFYGDKLYKPIIENGYVTGYTDNMDEPSDLDDWDGDTKHTVPSGPPSPPSPEPSDEDDYTNMGLGVPGNGLGGLTKYAILTRSEMLALVTDFNTNSQTGNQFSNHIICCYKLGVSSSLICSKSSGKIVLFRELISGETTSDFESSANYNLVSSQEVYIDCGGFDVPRMTGTFYDFSPYSSYELFIPCCGWINLPDVVAGRHINVYLLPDLPTCSCRGIVRITDGSLLSNGTTIASVNGILGSSIPFSIFENGLMKSATLSGAVQVMGGTGMVGTALATGNVGLGVSGVSTMLQGVASTYVAGNTNYTATKGGATDYSVFGDGYTAVLKINSPVVKKPTNFGHTVGYMCNKTGNLSSFSGFTICSNPHININATSREKEEIKRLLEEGVIL